MRNQELRSFRSVQCFGVSAERRACACEWNRNPWHWYPFSHLITVSLKKKKKAPSRIRKHLVGGWCLNEAFGVGAGRREDVLGKVHVLCGSRTNPALCLATMQDPCVPFVLGDLHPKG